MSKPYVLAVLCLCASLLGACATAGAGRQAADDEVYDPFEGFNRVMFRFNEEFDKAILKPVASGYDAVVPDLFKRGISNFFSNLNQPTVAINSFLQGKFRQAAADAARFIFNSTIGIFGIFDIVREDDLPANNEDFGQTLAVWGVADGPYLVLPIMGPRNLRDTAGWVADQFTYPLNYHHDDEEVIAGWILDIVDTRARLLPTDNILQQAAGDDKYLFVREAYRQRRLNLIHDGNPPRADFFLEEQAPAKKTP